MADIPLIPHNARHRQGSTEVNFFTGAPPPEGDEDWWPGYPDINQMYRHPAFTVQRDVLSYVEGGDYVRGSGYTYAGTLSGLGTALPAAPPAGTNPVWLIGEPIPTAVPPDERGRTAPGQTLWWDGTAWINIGVVPAVTQTALRYASTNPAGLEAARRGVLYCRPYDYKTIQIFWGVPGSIFDDWAEVAIVRSAFGYPATVNDGQTIFRDTRVGLFPAGVPENFTFEPIYDVRPPFTGGKPQLTAGRYYYYSLFFRINFEWTRSMTASSLLPRDHHHSEHLWNTLPPYYRWVDNQQRDQDGDLQRMLRVFGFELDTIREYVENWQELYHIDFSPVPLLRRLGPTFGVPYEAGIGEIRYRSLLSEIGLLYATRGTRPCLEKVCEAVSKYECDVTQTGNLMTLPDDSDFFEGTGNWAGINVALNPDSIIPPDVTVLPPEKVFYKSNKVVPPPTGYGRAVMEVWTAEADETVDVLLTCGCGVVWDVYTGEGNPLGPRYIYPIQVGILADNDGVYQFSCQIKMDVPYPVGVCLLWYDTDGGVMDYVNKSELLPTAPSNTNWKAYQSTGTVPEGAVYAVPAIHLKTRTGGTDSPTDLSPSVYIAAAAVHLLGSASRVSSEAPNPYLQMGNVMKRIGEPADDVPDPDAGQPPLPEPYPGYQIGKKE